ncbi:MAG: hypothetical protein IPN26_00720 [Bacteroidetes bacterium]|nr:hypothetical protein [Bacteroidota bacterium]
MIARAKEGFLLQEIIRDFKKVYKKTLKKQFKQIVRRVKEWILIFFSGKKRTTKHQCNPRLSIRGQDNHPKELWSENFINQKLDYIHNPVELGYVEKAEEYLYSSARDYYYESKWGLLK